MRLKRYAIHGREFPIIKTTEVRRCKLDDCQGHLNFVSHSAAIFKGTIFNQDVDSQATRFYINNKPVAKNLFHRYITRFVCNKPQQAPTPSQERVGQ